MSVDWWRVAGEEGEKKSTLIVDSTETNLMTLRRTIYLTIQSSLDFEECAHKLIKMQLKPGQEARYAHLCVHVKHLAAWCSGNVLVLIDKVALHWARLVPGWVTVCGR